MIGPITGTSAMMPGSQAKALEGSPTATTLPAITLRPTLKCNPSHTSPPIAHHSGSITFQFRHHGAAAKNQPRNCLVLPCVRCK